MSYPKHCKFQLIKCNSWFNDINGFLNIKPIDSDMLQKMAVFLSPPLRQQLIPEWKRQFFDVETQ